MALKRTPVNQRAESRQLRAAPSFALTFSMDGRPFVAKETEPYSQFWLSERDRILLSMFSARHGASVKAAIAGYLRLTGISSTSAEHKRLQKSISDMQGAGVLIDRHDDVSRYSARIVGDYVKHRPFPREISDLIIRDGAIGTNSRVLDLAGGPGDLSLALAKSSDQVTLMELSKGFVQAAARRARQQGLKLAILHDSCNRLIFNDADYEAVTISQALHWLDDVLVCRGVCRCLTQGGSFFVVLGAFSVSDHHPLAYLFGDHSILGHRPAISFAAQADALQKRLSLLFDALDSPDVPRIDPGQRQGTAAGPASNIVPSKLTLFHQRRPMDLGYARAFLTPAHIAVTGQDESQFWSEIETRCAVATAEQLEGNYDWALLQFKRGGARQKLGSAVAQPPTEIGYMPNTIL